MLDSFSGKKEQEVIESLFGKMEFHEFLDFAKFSNRFHSNENGSKLNVPTHKLVQHHQKFLEHFLGEVFLVANLKLGDSTYTGQINKAYKPHGVGLLIQGDMSYKGWFRDGLLYGVGIIDKLGTITFGVFSENRFLEGLNENSILRYHTESYIDSILNTIK